MKPEQIIEALEAACGQLAIAVRYETMTGEISGAGGLCKVKGDWRVIIDRKLNTSDRAAVLVDALAQFDTDNVFLPPQIREAVQARRGGPAPRSDSEPEQPAAEQDASSDDTGQPGAPSVDQAAPSDSAPAAEPSNSDPEPPPS